MSLPLTPHPYRQSQGDSQVFAAHRAGASYIFSQSRCARYDNVHCVRLKCVITIPQESVHQKRNSIAGGQRHRTVCAIFALKMSTQSCSILTYVYGCSPAGNSNEASQAATSQGQDATPSTKEDPIWISKREVRRAAPRTSGSKKTTYFIEFYLVDNHGYETLAATGEDQGALD